MTALINIYNNQIEMQQKCGKYDLKKKKTAAKMNVDKRLFWKIVQFQPASEGESL